MKAYRLNRLRDLSLADRLTALIVLLIALAGLTMVGQGLYIKAKAALGSALLERAFTQGLALHAPQAPWPWADTRTLARLSVPRLSQSAVILEGASGEALAWGAGHVAGTPLPGASGTSVLAAHRDTHFAFLGDVQQGDRVSVALITGETRDFVVTGQRIVRFDQSGIDPTGDEPRLVLSTCWPLAASTPGPWRLLVEARLVSPDPAQENGPRPEDRSPLSGSQDVARLDQRAYP